MWLAAEDDVAAFLTTHPTATPGQIDTRVCILVSPHDRCNSRIEAMHDTIKLAPNLFATTVSEDETGTVFIIGPRDGKPSVLWSIHTAQPQSADPHGLITAWQIERASDTCRERNPRLRISPGLSPTSAPAHCPQIVDLSVPASISEAATHKARASIIEQMSVLSWDTLTPPFSGSKATPS